MNENAMNSDKDEKYKIYDRYHDIKSFLPKVVEAADANRNALGFFPGSVFEDFARRERLIVLVKAQGNEVQYVGHLLFRPQFPRAHIMQMLILPAFRRLGLATGLIDHLKKQLTQQGFISIYARVAEDLSESNEYWHNQKFYVQRIEKGGSVRNRQILVRCHELPSPQLFPTSGIDESNPLGLVNSATDTLPLFLLDLNVLFDVAPRRLRHADAASLFQAERSNFCRLAISTEIRDELQRTAHTGRTDPMEAYIAIYTTFPFKDEENADILLKQLANLIFPNKKSEDNLSPNDKSDLRHVATAIQHDLAGLITNDEAILACASAIKKKFGIEIVSPASFKLDGPNSNSNTSFGTSENSTLELREISKNDEASVIALLAKLGLSGSTISAGWMPIDAKTRIAMCSAVWSNQTIVGYSIWAAKGNSINTTCRIAVDEKNAQAVSTARILLMNFLEKLKHEGPQNVKLELPSNQSNVREVAAGLGFRGTSDQNCLSKLVLGKVITGKIWEKVQNELFTKVELKLPSSPPTYKHVDQQVLLLTPSGNQTHIKLDFLETLLSPTLLCLPGRPAVITPIQSNFAAELLDSSPQGSLLPRFSASLYHDRHYLSDPKTLRHFKRGVLILFYESTKSQGRASVIAIARVRESYHRPGDADVSDLEHSVLTSENLERIGKSKMKTVTVFDNIFRLPYPVPLESLRKLGCGEAHQLITTRPLNDQQLQGILKEAFRYE